MNTSLLKLQSKSHHLSRQMAGTARGAVRVFGRDSARRCPPTEQQRQGGTMVARHASQPSWKRRLTLRSATQTAQRAVPTNFGVRLKTLALATLLAGTFFTAQAALKVGDMLPDLASFSLEGKLPEGLKGKVVIVDFWASWCEPCKESFPIMNDLQKKYADKGLVIIAVNVDEAKSDMQDFLKKNPTAFTVVRDAKQKLVATAGIQTMPSSFIFDAAGKIRFTHSGFHGDKTRKEYEREIESLLK